MFRVLGLGAFGCWVQRLGLGFSVWEGGSAKYVPPRDPSSNSDILSWVCITRPTLIEDRRFVILAHSCVLGGLGVLGFGNYSL